LFLLAGLALHAQNSTTAGRFHVEHPTLLNLGFEWAISGDANRNATVEVKFRATGESAWRAAMPLVRVGGENIYRRRENLDYTVPDGFAGSILSLRPGTEYECQFVMKDPDGASGQTTQTVKVKTRTEPMPYVGGTVRHVYSPEYKGPKVEPHYTSLLQAYYGAGLGLERGVGAAGAAGGHDSDACGAVQAGAAELCGPDDDAVRWVQFLDAEGDAGEADYD